MLEKSRFHVKQDTTGNVHYHIFSNFLQDSCAKYFWEKNECKMDKVKMDKIKKFGVCFRKFLSASAKN